MKNRKIISFDIVENDRNFLLKCKQIFIQNAKSKDILE